MKRPSNRQPVQKLLILGAGASFAASEKRSASGSTTSPLDNQFCHRIKNPPSTDADWAKDAQDYLTNGWLDEEDFANFGLEAAILRQIAHIEFLNAIQPRRRTGITHQGDYLNYLSHVITYVLSTVTENHRRLYKALAEEWFDLGAGVAKQKNRVITFNYDYLFDKYLLHHFSPEEVYFYKIKPARNKAFKKGGTDFPLILKLHGSANWLVETDIFKSIVDPDLDGIDYIDNIWIKKSKAKMPKPDDEASPLIIPPIQNKPVTSLSLFKYLWTRASEYIEEAEEIFICGYSLPETDLLAQILFRRARNKKVKNITIVDPNASILGKWMNLFSEKYVGKPKWHYYKTLSEFVEHGL